ncbi:MULTISPECIES: hypothetical protein [unclassified Bradyrhizobium]|nr:MULTISPECIES: hypothetical protein [unclassified Bradyrhizobium]
MQLSFSAPEPREGAFGLSLPEKSATLSALSVALFSSIDCVKRF